MYISLLEIIKDNDNLNYIEKFIIIIIINN